MAVLGDARFGASPYGSEYLAPAPQSTSSLRKRLLESLDDLTLDFETLAKKASLIVSAHQQEALRQALPLHPADLVSTLPTANFAPTPNARAPQCLLPHAWASLSSPLAAPATSPMPTSDYSGPFRLPVGPSISGGAVAMVTNTSPAPLASPAWLPAQTGQAMMADMAEAAQAAATAANITPACSPAATATPMEWNSRNDSSLTKSAGTTYKSNMSINHKATASKNCESNSDISNNHMATASKNCENEASIALCPGRQVQQHTLSFFPLETSSCSSSRSSASEDVPNIENEGGDRQSVAGPIVRRKIPGVPKEVAIRRQQGPFPHAGQRSPDCWQPCDPQIPTFEALPPAAGQYPCRSSLRQSSSSPFSGRTSSVSSCGTSPSVASGSVRFELKGLILKPEPKGTAQQMPTPAVKSTRVEGAQTEAGEGRETTIRAGRGGPIRQGGNMDPVGRAGRPRNNQNPRTEAWRSERADFSISIHKVHNLLKEPNSPKFARPAANIWGKGRRKSATPEGVIVDRSIDAVKARMEKRLADMFGETFVDRESMMKNMANVPWKRKTID